MARNQYTENFNNFWAAYPRKTAKLTAFKAWIKNGIEDDAFLPKQIVQNLEKRTRLKWWPRDHSKVPHAATWINQARWDDEGWEDEIKTREDGSANSGPVHYTPPVDTGPQLSNWELMLNRLARNYLLHAGGFTPPQLKKFIKAKQDVLKELMPAVNEEIAAAKDQSKTKGEMAQLLAETMLRRFDIDLNLKLKDRVLTFSRRST